jgi:hypothetical protein
MHAHADPPLETDRPRERGKCALPAVSARLNGRDATRIEDWLSDSRAWISDAAVTGPIESSGTFGSLSHQAQSLAVAMMLSALHAALGPHLPTVLTATAIEFDDWLRTTRGRGSGPVDR